MATYSNEFSGWGAKAPALLAPATSITVGGLAGDSVPGGGYKLRIFVKEAVGEDVAIYLRPNGATTNLSTVVNINLAGTQSGATDTGLWIGNLRASSTGFITVEFHTKSGTVRSCHYTGETRNASTGAVNRVSGSGFWTNTSAEITSFVIVAQNGAGLNLDVGSVLEAEPLSFFP